MVEHWSNWSGSVECRPTRIATPRSEEEIAAIVAEAAAAERTVRVAGSGHSFSPLCASDEVLLSLDGWAGIESADRAKLQATIRAGTKIKDMGAPLLEHDMALANQGDVDVQAIAGAISTGTHGTGRDLGNLSTQLVGLRLVDGRGHLREVDVDADGPDFAAAQVSLGALGVITAVRLQLLPAYRLHERLWTEDMETCLARLDERIAATRHFEFFWYPTDDLAHAKSLDPTDKPPGELSDRAGERIDHSYRVFPSVRDVRFNETEYAVPESAGPDCFRAIRRLMQRQYPDVSWPIEYRTLAADEIFLSPAHGRATVTISVHQAAELPYRAFFADVESIFREYHGRPHWGKVHTLAADTLRDLYPRFEQFRQVRSRFDPAGVFLNDHLRGLFGEGAA